MSSYVRTQQCMYVCVKVNEQLRWFVMKFLGRPQGPGVHGAALLFLNNSTLGRTSFKLNWNNDGAALGSSLLGSRIWG